MNKRQGKGIIFDKELNAWVDCVIINSFEATKNWEYQIGVGSDTMWVPAEAVQDITWYID